MGLFFNYDDDEDLSLWRSNIYLRFIKDTPNVHKHLNLKGEIHNYRPWPYDYEGMSEPERIKKGIFIESWGTGKFDRYDEGQDVEVV